ncbi:hydantoinase/oxoprolinase family protein [Paracoccus sp. Z118]|uniref:hydantoinase/oxoprolinase family protein n=1 Tax=Paracoccus sp. Z118 TaxID=2851017 RepID=UPI001C2BE87E|nr:hydantoinase/oxoprolinase family protein [Paracoccus sp. Z118]MBV0893325.1 hydantoinase/oxoprolinase family protein [Paracoccus sp. Z118]
MFDQEAKACWIVGVDVGGTFTDFAARNVKTGQLVVHKRPSTPADPSEAILTGFSELLAKVGVSGSDVGRLAHGTTVATNALLQRKGAEVGVVTTQGFRDLLEIGRQVRPLIYDLQADAPPPLAERRNRIEVAERVGPAGEVITELTDAGIEDMLNRIAELDGIQSLAVCLLFSFINPEHEQRIAAAIRQVRPDLYVSISSEVQPEFREFERFSTALINAFLQPEVSRYMDRLQASINAAAPNARLGIFQSAGGLMSVERAAQFPVRTALSGPAAGAVGAAASGAASNVGNIITLDIGGTSTDVCLIRDGRTEITHIREIAGFRIRLPMVDIHTVGAGGGSIARLGKDGLMKVGPESAGAVPGPACYGKSGTEPTVTDANVFLGRLPLSLAGGGLMIDAGKAEAVIRGIADKLGVSPVKAALGIAGIATSNMTRAIRAVSTERGHDPRDFTLMPFGGAGGLHAADVAQSLAISKILIPRAPGILCADGLLEAELQENFVASCRTPLEAGADLIAVAAGNLMQDARLWLAAEAEGTADTRVVLTLDMRYIGQNYELSVEVAGDPRDVAALREAFLGAHRRAYGHADPDAPIEVVNVRAKALASLLQGRNDVLGPLELAAPVAVSQVWFDEDAPVDTPIYERGGLPVGTALQGPVIISQFDSTTVVPPHATIRVDEALNLIMEIGHA